LGLGLALLLASCDAPVPGPPLTLTSVVGGRGEDSVRGVATDAQGNIYLAGGTASPDFPTTLGAGRRRLTGSMDVWVAKLSPAGQLLWSTLIGGPSYDRAYAVAVDGLGYVYVTGRAGRDFPVTPGALQTSFQGFYTGRLYGEQNAFVCKLTLDGRVVFCTYLGPFEMNRDLAVDGSGDIYVASAYNPRYGGGALPAAWFATAFQKMPRGGTDGVVIRLKSDGSRVVWATFVGGSGEDGGTPSIRVEASGSSYVLLGYTESLDLPVTPGLRRYVGGGDVYLAKLSPDGTSLLYGTYLGGSGVEFSETHGLALDTHGNAYVGATTESTDLPLTARGYQRAYGGSGGSGTGSSSNYPGDGFVMKISPTGAVVASTYLGGRFGEGIEGVAIDRQGNVVVGGATYSDNFPVTPSAAQATHRGGADMFVAKLSATLERLLYASYVGGRGDDLGRDLAVDAWGDIVAVGMTQSADFPSRNVPRRRRKDDFDGAIVKIAPDVATGRKGPR
jgi:hypothetical protein